MKHLEQRRCVLAHTHDPERPRTANRGWLCEGHWLGLEQHVAEMPALFDEVDRTLVRGSSNGPKISGDPERALPYDERAAEALHTARAVLVAWTRLVLDEHPSGLHSPADTLPAICTFLLTHLPWCAEQPWIDDLHREIRETRLELRRATTPPQTRVVPVGFCATPLTCDVHSHVEVKCAGELHAVLDVLDDEPRPVTCTDCDFEHPYLTWRALARRLHGQTATLLTYAELSTLFGSYDPSQGRHVGLPIGTLKRWASEDGWRRLDTRPVRFDLDDAQASYQARRGLKEAS